MVYDYMFNRRKVKFNDKLSQNCALRNTKHTFIDYPIYTITFDTKC